MSTLASVLSDLRKEAISRFVILARFLLCQIHQGDSSQGLERRSLIPRAIKTFSFWTAESMGEAAPFLSEIDKCDHPTCVAARTAGPFGLHEALETFKDSPEDRIFAYSFIGRTILRWAAEGPLFSNARLELSAEALEDLDQARDTLSAPDFPKVLRPFHFRTAGYEPDKPSDRFKEIDKAFTGTEPEVSRESAEERLRVYRAAASSSKSTRSSATDELLLRLPYDIPPKGATLSSFRTDNFSRSAWKTISTSFRRSKGT